MSLQSKSRLLSIPVNHSAPAHPRTGQAHQGLPTAPSLQSLAAELHQAATEGVFSYPRNWVLASRFASALILLTSLAHLVIVGLPLIQGESLSWQMAGAGLGVLLAVAVASFLCNLLPSLQVTPQGLGVSELLGWRRISWQQAQTLRVMELSNGRYVVMLPIKGRTRARTPAPMLKIMPKLLGASRNGDSGVMFTSGMRGFERLLQLVVAYMAQAAGHAVPSVEAFVDEDGAMPMAQLALDPQGALARLSHRPQFTEMSLDAFGGPRPETGPEVRWSRVLLWQLSVAAVPALLLGAEMLLQGDVSVLHSAWVGVLLLLGLVELPFIAKLLQAVGDLMVGRGQFRRSVLSYLELQAPRAVLLFLGVTFVGLGFPPFIAQVLWLAGIVATTVLCTQFVKRLYFIRTSQALLAGVGTFLFQISLFAIYFTGR